MVGILDSLGLGDSGNSGDSALSPESIVQRRRLAEALLQQGQADTPISHWSQGANRVLQSMLGTYNLKKLEQEDKAGSQAANSQLASVFGGGAATPAAPAVTPAMAAPAPQPAMPAIGSPTAGMRAAASTQEAAPPASGRLPMGMRVNNPGNIKYNPRLGYAGMTGPSQHADQGDPQMTFDTPQNGMIAAARLALTKYARGQNTAAAIIAGEGGWTPGNTAAAANIARMMGVAPNEDLRLQDPARMSMFLKALTMQEHGPASRQYPPEMYQTAAAAVGGRAAPAAQPAATEAAPAAEGLVPPTAASQLQRQAIALMKNPRNAALGRELLIKAAMAEAPKQPEAVQEYALAVKQGYTKPFMDYQIELKQASRPQTNVNVSGDKKGAEEMAKLHAKEYENIRAGANAARGNLANLDVLEASLDAAGSTGAFGETEQDLRRVAAYFGVGDADKAASGDLVRSISNKLALSVRSPGGEGGGMPGAMSDADREFLRSTVPSLGKLPGGNRAMIDIARKVGQRSIDIHKMAVQYARQHDGQLDPGFEELVNEYADQNPLFPRDDPNNPLPKAAPAVGASVSADGVGSLPDGAVIRDTAGKRYRIQGGKPVPLQ